MPPSGGDRPRAFVPAMTGAANYMREDHDAVAPRVNRSSDGRAPRVIPDAAGGSPYWRDQKLRAISLVPPTPALYYVEAGMANMFPSVGRARRPWPLSISSPATATWESSTASDTSAPPH